ncbi:MAG: alpha/beta fold hydrolase [Planctomycetota bacterium]
MAPGLDFPAFDPHPLLAHPYAMTLASTFPRRESAQLRAAAEERVVPTTPGNRVRVRRHRHGDGARPWVVLLHGLAGDLTAPYVVGTAEKAFRAGFDVARMNARNCGGTEELAAGSYHGGTTEDLLAVATALAADEGAPRVYLIGFSLGANMALRLAAELGDDAPRWLAAAACLSPCVDFAASVDVLERSPFHRLCQRRFLRSLRRMLRRRDELHGLRLDLSGLDRIRSLREFDARFTAPLGGFDGVDAYYEQASAVTQLPRVRIPALLVAARDDPLVPFATFERDEVRRNDRLTVLATARGGHVSFLARRPARGTDGRDADRRWGECRLIGFCRALERGASGDDLPR